MSEHPVSTKPSAAGPTEVIAAGRISFWNRSWTVATVISVIMVLLALVGVGLSTAESQRAHKYWVAVVPVFGLLSVAMAWNRARHEGQRARPMIVRQVLHWVGATTAITLDFFLEKQGELSGQAAGLNALLLLALSCYLSGVYFDWRFMLVGLLLTTAWFVVVIANEYMWLLFVGGGAIIAVLLGARWLSHRFARRKHLAHEAQHSAQAAAH
jgi:hypothetical protein